MPGSRARREALAALLFFVARLCGGLGVMSLVLASYAWWGNPATPLRGLAWPGGVLVAMGFVLGFLHDRAARGLPCAKDDEDCAEEREQQP